MSARPSLSVFPWFRGYTTASLGRRCSSSPLSTIFLEVAAEFNLRISEPSEPCAGVAAGRRRSLRSVTAGQGRASETKPLAAPGRELGRFRRRRRQRGPWRRRGPGCGPVQRRCPSPPVLKCGPNPVSGPAPHFSPPANAIG